MFFLFCFAACTNVKMLRSSLLVFFSVTFVFSNNRTLTGEHTMTMSPNDNSDIKKTYFGLSCNCAAVFINTRAFRIIFSQERVSTDLCFQSGSLDNKWCWDFAANLLVRHMARKALVEINHVPTTRVPQGVGWCRGANRNVVGWWGFP